MFPPLNQTPPVALLKSELIPMLVLQIGLVYLTSTEEIDKLIELCGTLHGDNQNFFPAVLNTHPESAYKMSMDVFKFKFDHGPEPLWFKNYSYAAE